MGESQDEGPSDDYWFRWGIGGEINPSDDCPLAERLYTRKLEHEPVSVAYSPLGTHVAVTHRRGALKGVTVLPLKPGEEGQFEVQPREWSSDFQMPVAFSSDGRVIATRDATRGVIALWVWAAGTTRNLEGHRNAVTCFDFQAGGRLLASGSADGAVHLWDWQTGAALLQLAGQGAPVHRVQFFADGSRLAAIDTKAGIQLWRIG